jgi:hypothetical protein
MLNQICQVWERRVNSKRVAATAQDSQYREQRPVHADRVPASQPFRRHGHQRQLFEVVLWLVLVQEGRLPVKPAADYVTLGQQVSLPTRQYAAQGSLGWLCCR